MTARTRAIKLYSIKRTMLLHQWIIPYSFQTSLIFSAVQILGHTLTHFSVANGHRPLSKPDAEKQLNKKELESDSNISEIIHKVITPYYAFHLFVVQSKRPQRSTSLIRPPSMNDLSCALTPKCNRHSDKPTHKLQNHELHADRQVPILCNPGHECIAH